MCRMSGSPVNGSEAPAGKHAEPMTLLVRVYVSQSMCMFITGSGTNRGAKTEVNTGTES